MVQPNNESLMMIEPQGAKEDSLDDELVKKAKMVLQKTEETAFTKGFHMCKCGKVGGSSILKTLLGRETNELIVHYVKCHRQEIPQEEINKLEEEYKSAIECSVH